MDTLESMIILYIVVFLPLLPALALKSQKICKCLYFRTNFLAWQTPSIQHVTSDTQKTDAETETLANDCKHLTER